MVSPDTPLSTTHEHNRQAKATRTSRPNANPPSEGFLDRLFAWLDVSLVRQAAGELARECHAAVWEATYEKARGMSRDEARGYVRAFAPEFLLKEVDLVLQRRRVRESLRQRILAEATEQLVELGRQGRLPDQIATVGWPGGVRSLLPRQDGLPVILVRLPRCLRVAKRPLAPRAFPVS